jgi:hypothetical protein
LPPCRNVPSSAKVMRHALLPDPTERIPREVIVRSSENAVWAKSAGSSFQRRAIFT